jgi:hypothetical protein
MALPLRYVRIASVSSATVAPSGGGAEVWTVNVNTGAASAILKIYDGTSASGTLVATIDASSKSSHCFGVLCPNGIFWDLSGGTADCTIGYL